jgi:hypothetical protein
MSVERFVLDLGTANQDEAAAFTRSMESYRATTLQPVHFGVADITFTVTQEATKGSYELTVRIKANYQSRGLTQLDRARLWQALRGFLMGWKAGFTSGRRDANLDWTRGDKKAAK